MLGFIGAESGLSFDMLARHSFGEKGSWLPSTMISVTQIGWFGVGLAMFAIPIAKELLGFEVTPDHMPVTCYALVLLAGILMTSSAYFGIKSLTVISYIAVPFVAVLGTVAMFLAVKRGDAGLIEQFARGSKDMSVIAGSGLVIGSFVSGGTATPNFSRFAKNGYALYTSGLGLSNILGINKRLVVLVAGFIGTVAAVWLYWNFCGWLNVLNCTLPPVGIILVLDYFINRKAYLDGSHEIKTVNWSAISGVIAGATVAINDWTEGTILFLPVGRPVIEGLCEMRIEIE